MTTRVPMTTGRLVVLMIAVPLVLIIIGWAGLSEVSYAGHASYPVRLDVSASGRTVTIRANAGNLNVRQLSRAAGSRFRLTGTARYSLVRSTVTWRKTTFGVIVVSRCHFVLGQCSFSYQLAQPAGSRTVLSSASGDIRFRALTSTDVTVSDDQGDVILTFTNVPDRVIVSDQLGDVTLVLPPGATTYRVRARTLLGDKSIGVPTSPSSAHVITVTNSSGDISITN